MLDPNSPRLTVQEFGAFFTRFIEPRMPAVRGRPNHGRPTPLRRQFSDKDLARLVANIHRAILLSI